MKKEERKKIKYLIRKLLRKKPIARSMHACMMSIYHDNTNVSDYLLVKNLNVSYAADMFNIVDHELRNKCQLFLAIFYILFINASIWIFPQRSYFKELEFTY